MRQSAIRFRAALGCAMILAAYSCADAPAGETAVSRNFDSLAHAIARCAGVYRSCHDAGVSVGSGQACTAAFRDCCARAGSDAENDLAVAIASCEDRADACEQKVQPSSGAFNSPCEQSLRVCLGETSDREINNPTRDYTRPNPYASSYQCFGQLQECVAAASSPTKCAASARTCVIDSVGEPPSRSTTLLPLDAGTRNAEAGSNASGAGGSSGAQSAAGAARGAAPTP